MDAGSQTRGDAPEAPDHRLLVGRDGEDAGQQVARGGGRGQGPRPDPLARGEPRGAAEWPDRAGRGLGWVGPPGHGDLPVFELRSSPSSRKTSASAGRKIVVLPRKIFS